MFVCLRLFANKAAQLFRILCEEFERLYERLGFLFFRTMELEGEGILSFWLLSWTAGRRPHPRHPSRPTASLT